MPILLDGTNGITTPTVTYEGNVVITGTARRIIGDFSNATVANRVLFQSSTTNGVTAVAAITNGTGATSSFAAYGWSDPSNAQLTIMSTVGGAESRFTSTFVGTPPSGTYLPMTFYTGGAERLRIDTSGRVLINSTAVPNGNFLVNNGTDKNVQIRGSIRLTGSSIQSLQSNLATDSPLEIYVGSAQLQLEGTPVTFLTSGIERMRIDASGNVGIGTSSPGVRLTVNAASGNIAQFSNAVDADLFINLNSGVSRIAPSTGVLALGTSSTERARIDSSGNLLVGTTSASGRLTVNGVGATSATNCTVINNSTGANLFIIRNDGAFFTGAQAGSPFNLTIASAANAVLNTDGFLYRSTSSLKYKTDVNDATYGLAELLTLRPVTYKGKSDADGDKVYGGLIAEEVHETGLTEFVQYAADGTPDALHYGNMVSLCIKAIQEQQAIIETLKSRLDAAGL